MKVVWKTVPSSGSGIREAVFSEPGPAPQLGVCSGVRRSRDQVDRWNARLSEHSWISTVARGWCIVRHSLSLGF